MRIVYKMVLSIGILISLCPLAWGHDDEVGFFDCYGIGHCKQDIMIYGKVVKESIDYYEIDTQLILRGIGSNLVHVKIKKTGFNSLFFHKKIPVVGQCVIVSYLNLSKSPHQANILLVSKTTDWRNIELDVNYRTGLVAEIEYFVRSGGTEDNFYWIENTVFVRHKNGTSEEIYPNFKNPSNVIAIGGIAFKNGTFIIIILIIAVIIFIIYRRVKRLHQLRIFHLISSTTDIQKENP